MLRCPLRPSASLLALLLTPGSATRFCLLLGEGMSVTKKSIFPAKGCQANWWSVLLWSTGHVEILWQICQPCALSFLASEGNRDLYFGSWMPPLILIYYPMSLSTRSHVCTSVETPKFELRWLLPIMSNDPKLHLYFPKRNQSSLSILDAVILNSLFCPLTAELSPPHPVGGQDFILSPSLHWLYLMTVS